MPSAFITDRDRAAIAVNEVLTALGACCELPSTSTERALQMLEVYREDRSHVGAPLEAEIFRLFAQLIRER